MVVVLQKHIFTKFVQKQITTQTLANAKKLFLQFYMVDDHHILSHL